ncbi:Hypothetical predicted protein [Cloeon dipterum]|uniref:Uncharacterized protein n=1 Tax=Cloeon dipterum TaxID=197152 RepID=A0A8S1DI64_9INSE|nr:Hypothetical predicted protein [Cloeon dipterum]
MKKPEVSKGNGAGNGERRRKQGLPAGRIVMSAAGIMDPAESRDETAAASRAGDRLLCCAQDLCFKALL